MQQSHYSFEASSCCFSLPKVRVPDLTESSHGIPCSSCKLFFASEFQLNIHKALDRAEVDARYLLELSCQKAASKKLKVENVKPCGEKVRSGFTCKYQCQYCVSQFQTFKGLKQHLGKVHDKTRRNAKCPVCAKRFKHKYAVKFHVRQVHERATETECQRCGKHLYNKYVLQSHLKTCNKV